MKVTKVIPYFHTDRVKRGIWTVCLWLLLTLYVRESLEDKSMLFTNFYLIQGKGKKQKLDLYLHQLGNTLSPTPRLFC